MTPFLTVITRHMVSRPNMMKINEASLAMQSDQDYEHMVLVDDKGLGTEKANARLAKAAEKAKGHYILILDDDDIMLNADGIKQLKKAAKNNPPIIVFKGWYEGFGILPPSNVWQQFPGMGQIGVFSFILRADVFREFSQIAAKPDYHNDFLLFHAAFDKYGSQAIWKDSLVCATMRRSRGRPE